MGRMTTEQWEQIRDEREVTGVSFESLGKKYGVSKTAIIKRSAREGWKSAADLALEISRKVTEKVTEVTGVCQKDRVAAIDAEAERIADIVRRHRREWEQVAGLRQEALKDRVADPANAFTRAKLAKITAEMTAIQQAGERKAWGLDAEKNRPDVVVRWEGVE